jgi:hypothetical protein
MREEELPHRHGQLRQGSTGVARRSSSPEMLRAWGTKEEEGMEGGIYSWRVKLPLRDPRPKDAGRSAFDGHDQH